MDLRADGPNLLARLERSVASEPPSAAVRSIYFGLFEGAVEKSHLTQPILYVSGSTRSTDDPGWACWDDSWLPTHRIFSIAQLAQTDSSPWESIQQAVGDLLRADRTRIVALLGNIEGRPVALGWDDGEPQILFIAKR